jgi:hypothetical protein
VEEEDKEDGTLKDERMKQSGSSEGGGCEMRGELEITARENLGYTTLPIAKSFTKELVTKLI